MAQLGPEFFWKIRHYSHLNRGIYYFSFWLEHHLSPVWLLGSLILLSRGELVYLGEFQTLPQSGVALWLHRGLCKRLTSISLCLVIVVCSSILISVIFLLTRFLFSKFKNCLLGFSPCSIQSARERT